MIFSPRVSCCLGVLIEIAGELRERREFAELREIELERTGERLRIAFDLRRTADA